VPQAAFCTIQLTANPPDPPVSGLLSLSPRQCAASTSTNLWPIAGYGPAPDLCCTAVLHRRASSHPHGLRWPTVSGPCTQAQAATVQRPLFGPPASMQPGPTGQVTVQGQPYYMEA